MIIFSLETECARRKAFSSRPIMRAVAAPATSSVLRSDQDTWLRRSRTLLAVTTTFCTSSVTMDSRSTNSWIT